MILVFTVAMSWAVRRSRFGLQLLAVRDDEARARGLGVKTERIKLAAFVLSAFPVGMVGGLYFYFLGQVFPQFAFDPLFDISIALMAFLGGIGTLAGPVLGAAVLEALQQYLTESVSGTGTYLIVYGVLFLVVILLLPRGVVPSITQLLASRRARAADSTEGPPRDPVTRSVAGASSMSTPARGHGGLEVVWRRAGAVGLPHRRCQRLDPRSDRAQRLGQDDAVQCDHRIRAHPAGRGPLRRRRRSRTRRRTAYSGWGSGARSSSRESSRG